MPLELSNFGVISSIISGPRYPNYLLALRAVRIKLGMARILPNPPAIGTPEFNHAIILQLWYLWQA
jgi:hypothetical protein